MAQKPEEILPLFLQTDNAPECLQPNESPFLKGVAFDINANPSEEAAATNGTKEGYNQLVQSPTRSNQLLPNIPEGLLPIGINKNVGSFESLETDEFYWANWNSEGNNGLYVCDMNTGVINTVIVDPNLPFTDKQHHFLNEHRWSIRCVYDINEKIIAKFLLFTN